jgi:hypothetical protein
MSLGNPSGLISDKLIILATVLDDSKSWSNRRYSTSDVERPNASFKGKLFDVLFSEQKSGLPPIEVENEETWRIVKENASKVNATKVFEKYHLSNAI